MKSCKDCKFSAPDNSLTFIISDLFGFNNRWRFAVCKHEDSKMNNKSNFYHLGVLNTESSYTDCSTARSDYGSLTICGSGAHLFQPK